MVGTESAALPGRPGPLSRDLTLTPARGWSSTLPGPRPRAAARTLPLDRCHTISGFDKARTLDSADVSRVSDATNQNSSQTCVAQESVHSSQCGNVKYKSMGMEYLQGLQHQMERQWCTVFETHHKREMV